MAHRPRLTFFAELPAAALAAVLASRHGPRSALDLLADRQAGLAVAMLDLSDQRAALMRRAAQRGVAVTAWLVLPEHHGYWLTADNAHLAHDRWREVRDWAAHHQIALAAIGLDIEAPHDDSVALVRTPIRALLQLAARRRPDGDVRAAAAAYQALVDEVRGAGLRCETYQFPFAVDERQAGSVLLQRTLGTVDVAGDTEVRMLYRSALPRPWGETLIDAYGPGADGIAVGITGGGVASLQPSFAHRELTERQVLADLRRAARYTDNLYVFSLEGCVQRGYLQAVCEADLRANHAPAPLRHVAGLARHGLRTALQLGEQARPWVHAARRWRNTP